MFSFLFRAAFWLALVYFLVPFDAIFGPGTMGSGLSGLSAPSAADTRAVTTSTIYVRPDGRIVRAASEPAAPRPAEEAAAPAAGRPGVADVMGFCDRNPRVCDLGVDVVYGAANKAGDVLAFLGDLVKPDTQPRRHTAATTPTDTLTDGDRLIAPGVRATP